MNAAAIAKQHRGKFAGGGNWLISCPVPGHGKGRGDRTPSLTIADGAEGRLLVSCKAGCNAVDILRHLEPSGRAPERRPEPATIISNDDRERTERALSIWEETIEPAGTLVEAYLAHRGVLEVARPAFSHTLRFHGRCPFGPGTRVPCLVALVRNVVTDEPQAIHRTAIGPDGRSVEIGGRKRMAFGPVRGGAVKLTPHKDVTSALAIGEGIESVLSIGSQVPAFGQTPAWSLISAPGVAAFPVIGDIETLWIAVDNDSNGVGLKAARTCFKRWDAADRKVLRVVPKQKGIDLNDLIKGCGP